MSQNTLLCSFLCLFFKHLAYSSPFFHPTKSLFLCRRGSGDVMSLEIRKFTQHPVLSVLNLWRTTNNKPVDLARLERALSRNICDRFLNRCQYVAECPYKPPQKIMMWKVLPRGLICRLSCFHSGLVAVESELGLGGGVLGSSVPL